MELEEHIIDIDVTQEMEESFLEYAYSVIYSRALPDARDGLKPVQRRILFMMAKMGLSPEKGHVKSARVVGEVMGKLHPHGDGAIYDALVRMAQDFSLRLPLIDGHGNFGSLDDGPAAARYTEARLALPALLMTENLDKDVVNFIPNYDNRLTQPEVLPAAYPNLLVNGASGIAVGMATNMAPHNVQEVIAGAIHLLQNPEATTKDLMTYIPGPDLPTGGRIIGLEGIKDAYEHGKGSFKIRATASIGKIKARKNSIIFTELPYLVGPEKIIDKVKSAVTNKKVQGISDITDLTDRKKGTQLVVEIKTGFNPQAVLEQLYTYTPLEESFSINNVALVKGQPRILGLKSLLTVYIDHRLEVVHRRTTYDVQKKLARLHVVEGLLLALVDIDKVIDIVRSSDEAEQAKDRLQTTFGLSKEQATYILDVRLRQLTKFSTIELDKERHELEKEIAQLQKILDSPSSLRDVVIEELKDVAKHHGTARRTVLLTSEKSLVSSVQQGKNLKLEIKDEPCFVALSATGMIARTPDRTLPTHPLENRQTHDVLKTLLPTTARNHIGAITNFGRMLRLNVVEFPVLPDTTKTLHVSGGAAIDEYVDQKPGEKVVGLVNLGEEDAGIALATTSGVVKRVSVGWPVKEDEWSAISLAKNDHVVAAFSLPEDWYELVFITEQSQLLHFPATKVRPQGRSGGGITGINLIEKDQVIFFGFVNPTNYNEVLTMTAPAKNSPDAPYGRGKISNLTEFPSKGRATKGVRAQRFLIGEHKLLHAWAGPGPALAANSQGKPLRFLQHQELVKRDSSGTPITKEISFLGPYLGHNNHKKFTKQ